MDRGMSKEELEEFIAEGEYQELTKYDDAMMELDSGKEMAKKRRGWMI